MLDATPTSALRAAVALSAWISLTALAGCGPDKDSGVAGDTEADGTSTGNPSAATMSASGAMTADDTAGVDGGVTTNASDGQTTTSTDGGSFIEMPTGSGDGGPQGLGGMCDGNTDCVSGFCYSVPMIGAACSECLMDSDCETGTCALDVGVGYAVCTDGSVGVMCDSDTGCAGELVCAELLNTGGLFPANFCSECDTDLPCAGEQICTPVYDLGNFAGSLQCADPGSVPDGGGCPLGAGGGSVCDSGFCGTANVFGFVDIGVCGACVLDQDCMDPLLTCTPPAVDMAGVHPAVCE